MSAALDRTDLLKVVCPTVNCGEIIAASIGRAGRGVTCRNCTFECIVPKDARPDLRIQGLTRVGEDVPVLKTASVKTSAHWKRPKRVRSAAMAK